MITFNNRPQLSLQLTALRITMLVHCSCEVDIITINDPAGQYIGVYRYNLLLDALTGVVGWLTGDAEAYQTND